MAKKLFGLIMAAVVSMTIAFGGTADARYLNAGNTSDGVQTIQSQQTSKVQELKPVATMSLQQARQYDIGSQPNANVVMRYDVNAIRVVTVDRFRGLVSLYEVDTIEDFAQLGTYFNSGMLVAFADKRAAVGLDEGIRLVRNEFLKLGVTGEYLSATPIMEESLEQPEIDAITKVLASRGYYAYTVHIDVQRLVAEMQQVTVQQAPAQQQGGTTVIREKKNIFETVQDIDNAYRVFTGHGIFNKGW